MAINDTVQPPLKVCLLTIVNIHLVNLQNASTKVSLRGKLTIEEGVMNNLSLVDL